MIPEELLATFSPAVRQKAQELAESLDTPILSDAEVYPQAWRVRSEDRGVTHRVHLVCEPGTDGTSEREIHGARCTCLNGKNTPLGAPRCYHVAAVLLILAGYARR